RDRLSWPEMEPTKGHFADHNIYDDTAAIQHEGGLKILQVNHISPTWANPNGKHFPLDLRDEYEFQKAMAARWKGKVLASSLGTKRTSNRSADTPEAKSPPCKKPHISAKNPEIPTSSPARTSSPSRGNPRSTTSPPTMRPPTLTPTTCTTT